MYTTVVSLIVDIKVIDPALRCLFFFFFFQAEDGIRDVAVTGVQTCALPISPLAGHLRLKPAPRSPLQQSERHDARRPSRARPPRPHAAALAREPLLSPRRHHGGDLWRAGALAEPPPRLHRAALPPPRPPLRHRRLRLRAPYAHAPVVVLACAPPRR